MKLKKYWATWCRLAADWVLSYCATANAEPGTIDDARFRGRGHCCFEEKCANVKTKGVSDSGDIIDPRLASAFKIRRILNEIIVKQGLLR